MKREMLYYVLYEIIRKLQGTFTAAFRDPRLYTNDDHSDEFVPLARELIDVVRVDD